MKNKEKKVLTAWRISPEILKELKERSAMTGQTQTRLLEDALNYFFSEGMKRSYEAKLKMVRGRGFEPLTPTVSR